MKLLAEIREHNSQILSSLVTLLKKDTVELIMEFEKAFEITIPDDKAEKISTVADAIAFIEANK